VTGHLQPIAQSGQRRLQIVGDIVGDMLYAAHQPFYAPEHGVQIFRQAIEFVAGARHLQTAGQISLHDLPAGRRNRIDPFQHTPVDEEPTDQSEKDHGRAGNDDRPADNAFQSFAFGNIAADEYPKSATQAENPYERPFELIAFGGVQTTVTDRLRTAVRILEHITVKAGYISGQDAAGKVGYEIQARSRRPAAAVDHMHETANAALAVLTGKPSDFGFDPVLLVLKENLAGVERDVSDEEKRQHGEHNEVKRRKFERRRSKDLTECCH